MNKLVLFPALIALAAALTACAPPTPPAPAVSAPTQPLAAATVSPLPTATNAPAAAAPTALAAPLQTETACTDGAAFVMDVTISDGTTMAPGQAFTKTWRVKNTGTCTWTTAYTFVLEEGPVNAFWTDSPHLLTGQIEPGQSVDLSTNLAAPTILGDYTASYQLRSPTGVPFLNLTAVIKVQAQAAAGFAVTHVAYAVSTWSDTVNGLQYVNCPLLTASVTTNSAGTVKYHWIAFDGKTPGVATSRENGVLTFEAAGTQAISQRVLYRESSGGQGQLYLGDSGGIYLDQPDHPAFEGVFLPTCTTP